MQKQKYHTKLIAVNSCNTVEANTIWYKTEEYMYIDNEHLHGQFESMY